METIQDKEEIIIGTIINCNSEIRKFLNESRLDSNKRMKKFYESYNSDVYHYNMLNLYSSISGVPFINLMESFNGDIQIPNAVTNKRNNYYSYFSKVSQFLNGFELSVQQSLNESITVDNKKVAKPIQINITSFKDELKNIIETLSRQNDIENYSSDILKIKTFAKQPLFINGYNICNNIALMRELNDSFGILYQHLIAVCFNRNTKQLYFVTNNTNKLIVYDVLKDELGRYSDINQPITTQELKGSTYLDTIKKITGINAITELYLNASLLNLKFEDNLYHDNAYANFRLKMNNQTKIVK